MNNESRPHSMADEFETFKVPELKQMLKEKNLPVSGKKKELIERLKTTKKEIKFSNIRESNSI